MTVVRSMAACWANVADTRISIYLGSRYLYGKVEGLCGNYNGKSSDDLGAETSLSNSLVDLASAWKTIPSCPEPELQLTTDPCEVCYFSKPIFSMRDFRPHNIYYSWHLACSSERAQTFRVFFGVFFGCEVKGQYRGNFIFFSHCWQLDVTAFHV